jgi:hypothetical protein
MKPIAIVSIVWCLLAVPAVSEDQVKQQKQPVFLVDNSGFPPPSPVLVPIPGDWGRLIRKPDRVIVQARLTNLNPEWVYNFHIFVFNNPAACLVTPPFDAFGSRCTPLIDQGPATQSSIISFGGFIPDSSGSTDLEYEVKISEGLPPVGFFGTNGSFTNVVNGPGLTNPMGAEIQFDVARKGPLQQDMTMEQFQTMFGACGADFTQPPLDPNQLCEIVRESRVGGTLSLD